MMERIVWAFYRSRSTDRRERFPVEEAFLFTYLCVNYQREWWSWGA